MLIREGAGAGRSYLDRLQEQLMYVFVARADHGVMTKRRK